MNQRIQTSETKFLYRVNNILQTIEKNSPINRFALCRMLNITPKQYELLHPYLVEAYPDKLEFSTTTKQWTWKAKPIKKPVVDEEEIPMEDEEIPEDGS